jgi:LssY C-terminus
MIGSVPKPEVYSRLRTLAYAPFLLLALALVPANSRACEEIPANQSFWVRLVDPVATYSSHPGTLVRAVLIQSPDCAGAPVFPAGLEVDGKIVSVRRVGLGFKHDVASIEVLFDHLVTVDGDTLPIAARVVEVDNARESVRDGVIHGIRATNTPQGRITSRLIHLPTFNPYTDWGLIVYRSIFTKLPEPEIYLPPGTDLRLTFTAPLNVASQPELPRPDFNLDETERGEIEAVLDANSSRTTTSFGKDADVVNVVFLGSAQQLQQAFAAAGWQPGDHNSTHAFMKQFEAFLTFSNYPTAPVSHQLLSGQPQTFTWQKSFDSYEKREHLRIWSEPSTVSGQPIWLSAYTRETSAVLSVRYHKFIHHIDPNLDEGTVMLVRDLTLAGCVDSVGHLSRPDLPHNMINATGDEMYSDGVIDVVHLKDCQPLTMAFTTHNPLVPVHPRSKVSRYIRTEVLVYKSDVIRGNLVYGAFDVCRMGIHSFRHRHDSAIETAAHRQAAPPPVPAATPAPQVTAGFLSNPTPDSVY